MPQNIEHKDKDIQAETLRMLIKQRDGVFKRFPMIFTLLGTFGLVATYYGFQQLIKKVPLLANDPYITLAVGLIILLFTGTLYKKLG
jgi:hypothetical protein